MTTQLLPPNANKTEQAMEQTTARVGEVPMSISHLWNPATCPASLLPWLAWALAVDEWDSAWPEEVKRQAIKESLQLHRRKGTRWAVERALKVTGFPQAKLREWFEYAGDPGHFKVAIDLLDRGIDEVTWNRLDAFIERYKNKRSWIQNLDLWLTGMAANNHASTCTGGEMLTVYPFRTTAIEQGGLGYHALGLHTVETITVYPQT